MSERVKLVVNGETREYEHNRCPATVSQLLDELALPATMIVVELNGEIVPREAFPVQALSAGDSVELVRFVGGG